MEVMRGVATKRLVSIAASLLASACAAEASPDADTLAIALSDRVAESNRDRGKRVDAEDRKADDDKNRRKRKGIVPVLHCVESLENGELRAHWGYRNDNADDVRRKLGKQNRLFPTRENSGQPTLFRRGTFNDAFTVRFSAHKPLIWFLDDSSAFANQHSRRCAAHAAGSGGHSGVAGHPEDCPGGSAGKAAAGAGAGGSAAGGNSACDMCEASGTGSNNCPIWRSHCDNLTGVTGGTFMPGLPKSQLCRQIVACIHNSHCAQSFNASDCLCGTDVQTQACFTGSFTAMRGSCRDLIAAGAETNLPDELSLRFADVAYAAGSAVALVENCDYTECNECL